MLNHRPVEDNDIPIICQFPQNEEELFYFFPQTTYPLQLEILKKNIEQRFNSTVIIKDQKVVGFANLFNIEDGNKCSIGNVIVAPDYRHQGVGRYLIETMIKIALDEHRVKEIIIAAFNSNLIGLLLYSKLGFKPFKIEERKHTKGNKVALIYMNLLKNNT